MVIKKLTGLILLSLLVSCGARDQKHFPVLLKGQITTGMPKSYFSGDGLISSLKRQDLILDTDRDKIADRDDFDIDNDGIPNDCDLAPFDKTNGVADSDKDGLPDFCDLTSESVLQKTQAEVFVNYGIMLNLNEGDERTFDSALLKKALAYVSKLQVLPNTNLVTIAITDGLPLGEYGVYDVDWRNVRLKVDESVHEEFSELTSSAWSMVHELFHFVGTNKSLYQEFDKRYAKLKKNDLLMYPTEYSRVSEEEFFAEENTFNFFFSNKI